MTAVSALSPPRRTRWLGSLVLAVTALLALGACSQVESVLDAADRAEFIAAANKFISASDNLQTSSMGVTDEQSAQDFAQEAQTDVDEMKSALKELEDVTGNVDGDAQKVADKAVAAAKDTLRSSEDVIAAIQNGDEAALFAAAQANTDAIDAFNKAADEWNSLGS